MFIDVSKAVEKTYKGDTINLAARLAEILLEDYNTAVVLCADFGFPNHIRLSYATSMGQIEKGLGRFESFLKSP